MTRKNKKQGRTILVKKIAELKRTDIKPLVDLRIRQFSELKYAPVEKIFSEMCFCITTANCAAESCIRIQRLIGKGFTSLPEEKLSARFKELGYRFPNKRASYIVNARKYSGELSGKIRSGCSGRDLREWLSEKITGLGYKESSHFLRNIGYSDLAIIDFHIVDLLAEHCLVERPKTMTKNKYLAIEKILEGIARKANVTLAELDLYLWYIETGKVLK